MNITRHYGEGGDSVILIVAGIVISIVIASLVVIAIIRKGRKTKNPCRNCRPRNRVCIGCPVALRREYDYGRNRSHESSKKSNKKI